MKKIILLAAVLITVIGLNVWAEKEVLIYQGEYITSTPMSNIDSIGFIHNEIFHNEEDWSETNLLFYKGCHKSNIGRVDYIDSVVFTSDIPPVIQAFYCEFVPAGEVLRVAGKNFFNPSVYFYGENGDLIKASKVETKGSTELFITVPEGATHSKPIVVETAYGKTESKILFRDRRNIFIDFDNLLPTVSGTMEPGGTGGANPKPKWKESLLDLLPAGFELPKGCDGLYDQVNLINFDEGGYISYYTELGGRTPQIPLYGNFGNMSVEDLVLKFEVYTPNQYAINGIYADVTFPPKGNNGMRTSGRELTGMRDESCVPGTWWCPFEGNIDKLDPNDWIWQIGLNAKEYFYTDWSEFSYSGNWMTVSIPLSSFIWNIMDRGIQTDMENNFGINSVSCTAYNKELVVGDWTKAMGDFTFMWEPWAYSGQVGRFLCFLDNFRIVPDDGNGVQYGKLGQRAYTGDIFTGGRPYPQNSSALVEYNSSIVTVSGFDNDGNETPLTADAEVTIFGERLDLVEKIVFSNGVETFPVRQSANQLTLTFPKEAFDGTLEFGLLPDRIVWGLQMSLVVSPKTEGEETVHIPTPVIVFDQDLQSEKALEELTKTLYGGQIWQNYMDKFDWCAHESMAGNLYQTFGQESLFFQLNLSANNDIIKMGYEGLYIDNSRPVRSNDMLHSPSGFPFG